MALLLIPLFLALMYVLVILPQQRRVRAHAAVVDSLAVGQQVMTTSGVYGTLVEVGTETVMLEVAAGVQVKVARASVGLIVTADEGLSGDDGSPSAEADTAGPAPSDLHEPAAADE